MGLILRILKALRSCFRGKRGGSFRLVILEQLARASLVNKNERFFIYFNMPLYRIDKGEAPVLRLSYLRGGDMRLRPTGKEKLNFKKYIPRKDTL